jgi:hypothetical protein
VKYGDYGDMTVCDGKGAWLLEHQLVAVKI